MILVLCPTRGRPQRAREAYQSLLDTRAEAETEMVFAVDANDPERAAYEALGAPLHIVAEPRDMGVALQDAAMWATKPGSPFRVIGFVGDDHRFRTPAWDRTIGGHLLASGGGFAYANDLGMGASLPTAVFATAEIIRALGWFGLPGAHHLYFDNTWRDLGDAADCLYYFPDIVIEHMHPIFGKAPSDEGYTRVNAPENYSHDLAVFTDWTNNRKAADVETVRSTLRR